MVYAAAILDIYGDVNSFVQMQNLMNASIQDMKSVQDSEHGQSAALFVERMQARVKWLEGKIAEVEY